MTINQQYIDVLNLPVLYRGELNNLIEQLKDDLEYSWSRQNNNPMFEDFDFSTYIETSKDDSVSLYCSLLALHNTACYTDSNWKILYKNDYPKYSWAIPEEIDFDYDDSVYYLLRQSL